MSRQRRPLADPLPLDPREGLSLARGSSTKRTASQERRSTLAEAGDFLMAHADALMDYAEVLELAGSADEAVPVLEDAVARCEQKGNIVMAARARAELARLTRLV